MSAPAGRCPDDVEIECPEEWFFRRRAFAIARHYSDLRRATAESNVWKWEQARRADPRSRENQKRAAGYRLDPGE
jgi:hypothetical protein